MMPTSIDSDSDDVLVAELDTEAEEDEADVALLENETTDEVQEEFSSLLLFVDSSILFKLCLVFIVLLLKIQSDE